MATSETAVAIAIVQWGCCPVSLNIVAIAIAQWEPALTDTNYKLTYERNRILYSRHFMCAPDGSFLTNDA